MGSRLDMVRHFPSLDHAVLRQTLDKIDDQFMVGPAIMQAPFVTEGKTKRSAVLPACRWYRADTDTWMEGGQKVILHKEKNTTPIFIREGSVIPMQRGIRKNNRNDLSNIERIFQKQDVPIHLIFIVFFRKSCRILVYT